MTEPIAYLNGQIVAAHEARLPVYDAGVVLGATVTEMTRTFRGRLFRLDDHIERLFASMASVGFEVSLTQANFARISREIVEHNAQLLGPADDLGLIQFVTAGEYPTYAGMTGRPRRTTPTVCLHTFPLPLAQWAEKIQHGAHLVVPDVRHVPAACCDPSVKHRSRLPYYLAEQQARRIDPEATALLLDMGGFVTETPTANFLIVEGGAIVSPQSANILWGVSRQTVIELASTLGIAYVERDITVEEAAAADEALLTSTPYCLLPVTRLNGRAIGSGNPGPMFERLLAAWSEQVGLDIREQMLAAHVRA